MNNAPAETSSLSPTQTVLQRYWQSNLRLTLILLVGWAVVGLGAGILFADKLDEWKLPGTGYPLGFWFAQQGSIVAFVVIILIYAVLMNRLDRRHHDELAEAEAEEAKNDTGGDAA
jgi:putative solute:sodium symporter small subunit